MPFQGDYNECLERGYVNLKVKGDRFYKGDRISDEVFIRLCFPQYPLLRLKAEDVKHLRYWLLINHGIGVRICGISCGVEIWRNEISRKGENVCRQMIATDFALHDRDYFLGDLYVGLACSI